MVAIDVDVEEPVVGTDLLQLRIVLHQRLPIPKPNVVDGPAVVLERPKGEILFRGKMVSPRSGRGCRLPA